MKTVLYVIYGLLFLLIGVLIARFILGGPEDSWICKDGVWVKHGFPRGPTPTTNCFPPDSEDEGVPPKMQIPD